MVIERRIAQRRQEEAYVEAVAEQEARGRRVIESATVGQSKGQAAARSRLQGGRPPGRAVPRGGGRAVPARRRGGRGVRRPPTPHGEGGGGQPLRAPGDAPVPRHVARAQGTRPPPVGQSPEDRERRSERKRVLRRRVDFLAESWPAAPCPSPATRRRSPVLAHGAGQRQRLGPSRGAAGGRARGERLGRQGLAPAHPRVGRPLQRRPAARGHGDGRQLRRGTHQLLRGLWRRAASATSRP